MLAPRTSERQTAEISRIITPKQFAVEFIWREYQNAVFAKFGTVENESAVRANIDKIVEWLQFTKSRPWLRISGYIGNGKSTMLGAIKSWYEKTHPRMLYTLVTAQQVIKVAQSENKDAFDKLINFPRLMIDDLGTEPNEILVFGNKMQPIRELLYHRYDRRLQTVFTTNLTDKDFSDYYGERIADRCRELQAKIVFTEKSYRK